MSSGFDLHSGIILICALIFVCLCLQGINRLAAKLTDVATREANVVFTDYVGKAPSYVLAYGQSAIGVFDDREDLFFFGKDRLIRSLTNEAVSGWYVGAVLESPFGDFIKSDYDSRADWVLIYGRSQGLVVKVGILHKFEINKVINQLLRIFPDKSLNTPGELKLRVLPVTVPEPFNI